MLQNKTQNIWNAANFYFYKKLPLETSCPVAWKTINLQLSLPSNQYFSPTWIKGCNCTNQNIQNHLNIFDPSRIGQELRLRAWQKRHQGPTYESQGRDVLGCLRWTEGVDLLMVGLPHAKFIYISINKNDSKVTLFFIFALLTCDLRSIITWESHLALKAEGYQHPTREWRIFRPKFRASKNQHQTVKFGLLYRKKSQIWDHLVFTHAYVWDSWLLSFA